MYMYVYIYVYVCICIYVYICIVTWSPTERREIRNFPYPYVFELPGLKD